MKEKLRILARETKLVLKEIEETTKTKIGYLRSQAAELFENAEKEIA